MLKIHEILAYTIKKIKFQSRNFVDSLEYNFLDITKLSAFRNKLVSNEWTTYKSKYTNL